MRISIPFPEPAISLGFGSSKELNVPKNKTTVPVTSKGWASNFKNVAPLKQNAICKPRAQYAKRVEKFKAQRAQLRFRRPKFALGHNKNKLADLRSSAQHAHL
jgi:hypothetical protein